MTPQKNGRGKRAGVLRTAVLSGAMLLGFPTDPYPTRLFGFTILD